MAVTNWIAVIAWLVFIVDWGVSAIDVKPDVKGAGRWWRAGSGYRIRLFIAAILIGIVILRPGSIQGVFGWRPWATTFYSIFPAIGAALCVLGIGFAIWARRHLGRNWSSYPTLKEGHELVTSGPYRFVRHPIYTGMLTALAGSALVDGVPWIFVFLVFSIVFVSRVRVEERLMTQQFPNEYPDYKKRTKALIPFVW